MYNIQTYEGFLDFFKSVKLPWDKLDQFLKTTSPFDIREILREVTDIIGEPRDILYFISIGQSTSEISQRRTKENVDFNQTKGSTMLLSIDKNKDRYCHLALDGTEKDIKSSLSPSFFKKVPTGSSLYFRIIIGPHDDCREFDQSMLNDMAGSIEDMCGFEESMAIQRDSRNQKTQGNESVITEIELIFKF